MCEANEWRSTWEPIWRRPAFLHARHSGNRVHGAEQLAVHVAEHERSAEMTVRLEGRPHFDPERDLARLAGLRRADLPVDDVLPDRDPSCDEIDVLPAQTDQLPYNGLRIGCLQDASNSSALLATRPGSRRAGHRLLHS